MPALDKHETPLPTTTVKWRFPSVHPEGRKFAVIAAAITAVAFLLDWDFLAWLLVGVTVWVAAFFRDPIRTTPRGDKLIVAPADGLITLIARVPPPAELRGPDGLAEGDYTECFRILLQYYDKQYLKGLHNRENLSSLLIKIPCETVTENNAVLLSGAKTVL